MPPELRRGYVRPTDAQKARRAIPVLRAALRLLVECGWCQGALADGTGRFSLSGAVTQAGVGAVDCEYAREQLRQVLWTHDLPGWNDHPARRKREVTEALRRALKHAYREAGMMLRGGWRVSR